MDGMAPLLVGSVSSQSFRSSSSTATFQSHANKVADCVSFPLVPFPSLLAQVAHEFSNASQLPVSSGSDFLVDEISLAVWEPCLRE